MKIAFTLTIWLITGICSNARSQCKTTCSFSITNTKTKQVIRGVYTVEVKTGWDMWVLTRDISYKSSANIPYIFALVYMPNKTAVLKAFKGTGPDLVWSGAAPSVNCDVFPWGGFAVTDISGNKGFIKIASY